MFKFKGGHSAVCVYEKYYKVSIVKYNLCTCYYYVRMFLHEQHVSTQLRSHHQASIAMQLKMAVHKQLAYLRDSVRFTQNIKYVLVRRTQVKLGMINLCKGLFSLNARIYYKLKSGTYVTIYV
jgi:hypothetical protein